ncbi:MAG TPA: GNAT family protein [Methylovirgula sp.]|nr:GNAT family protein [Methylovirgula sp.]
MKAYKRNIRIDCGKYLVRTMKADDASERFANWLSDRGAIETLNLQGKQLGTAQLAAYIKSFDQWSHWLLAVVEKQTHVLIGMIRLDVDYADSRSHACMLIGEPDYRNKGATADVLICSLDYVFETVGISRMTACALSRNQLTIGYLQKAGWRLETARNLIKSNSDGSMLELSNLCLTRENWRAWKETAIGKRILQRVKANRHL